MTTVHVPKNRHLAALLHGGGGRLERHLNELGNAADGAAGYVVFADPPPAGLRHAANAPTMAEVGAEVAAVYQRARAAGSEHAHLLEPLMRQLGVPVPAPEPAAAPAQVPPIVPAPPAAPVTAAAPGGSAVS